MRIALFEPDIAGNVGTILRLGACLDVAVDLIEPMGFPWGDRALRRAGMDYAGMADVRRHADWAAFRAATTGRIVLATTRGAVGLWDAAFRPDDVLLLGSEGRGVTEEVHAAAALRVAIPLRAGMRSLNVAVAGAMIAGEMMRQLRAVPLPST
ncbi:MAG TPA: tRNA (cytidine(34)-2'-O)-methyltransferase [Sphingomonas sp.]|jgi:tRNA (cytidine/uridine-2'-O-)-methyltransferase|uniref:tRNA (cytidine(34)-2'-O)-methyltransferase n=1 Tax=Sphingomonas sp. TaxID=28214 RepID=UPI002EDB4F04